MGIWEVEPGKLGSSQEAQEIEGYKENIKSFNNEIERLKEKVANAPDPVELVEVRDTLKALKDCSMKRIKG